MPDLRVHGTVVPHSWFVDYAANCRDPITLYRDGVRVMKGKPLHGFGRHPAHERPVMVEMLVPCRQCEACLRRRAAHWRLRAYSEWRAANRTWFGTLTLTPEFHFRVKARAALQMQKNGDDFDALPQEAQFLARHREISKEITLYVKRIRKESGAELRLLCVTEAHKSGLPHYHMLVHEVGAASVIRHAVLSKHWRIGFSNWKLVDTAQAAGYVCKYLSKSNLARVRASVAYGSPPALAIANDEVKRVESLLQSKGRV